MTDPAAVCIIFDGPPGPEAPRFVEVERPDGTSIRLGTWEPDPHVAECWRLRITLADMQAACQPKTEQES